MPTTARPVRRGRSSSGKTEGISARFDRFATRTGQLYFIKFDPPSNPEMASGAEVISTKFFHAFGYHVPENYIATHPPRIDMVIAEGTTIEDEDGRERHDEAAGSRLRC